ncbi:hypothetical protein llap_11765 [Limosa lapponica baueri]|uniref:Uncharacterized protein n=1 Tax=Limosa lapponica baueri TaxID=1758121 RepID=A0A2I0TVS7_LIMLA|nr:hypothetical protein llap_11765 [Limosa lapponica baueri]
MDLPSLECLHPWNGCIRNLPGNPSATRIMGKRFHGNLRKTDLMLISSSQWYVIMMLVSKEHFCQPVPLYTARSQSGALRAVLHRGPKADEDYGATGRGENVYRSGKPALNTANTHKEEAGWDNSSTLFSLASHVTQPESSLE